MASIKTCMFRHRSAMYKESIKTKGHKSNTPAMVPIALADYLWYNPRCFSTGAPG